MFTIIIIYDELNILQSIHLQMLGCGSKYVLLYRTNERCIVDDIGLYVEAKVQSLKSPQREVIEHATKHFWPINVCLLGSNRRLCVMVELSCALESSWIHIHKY